MSIVGKRRQRRLTKKLGLSTLRRIKALVFGDAQGRCFDCGGQWDQLTLGHLVPLARNGSYRQENLVAQCRGCNMAQGGAVHRSVLDREALKTRPDDYDQILAWLAGREATEGAA